MGIGYSAELRWNAESPKNSQDGALYARRPMTDAASSGSFGRGAVAGRRSSGR